MFVTSSGGVVLQGDEVASSGMAEAPSGERQVTMDLATWRELARQVEAGQGDPFASFTHSAFRLEVLPQYLVDVEAERFQAFREGRPLPPWPAESVAWFESIAASTSAGRSWSRVHVVDQPLSEYTRFELECYRDNVGAGEDVRIAERALHPELAELVEDFWLFDAETDHPVALLMRYAADGRWLGYWRTEDRPVIDECRRQRDVVLAASIPLAAYGPAAAGER